MVRYLILLLISPLALGQTVYNQIRVPASGTNYFPTLNASDVNPSNSASVNAANLAAHISACVNAGGCVIALGAYSSVIPIDNSAGCAVTFGVEQSTGSTAADTPYNNITLIGAGYSVNPSTQRATSGTVLQGNSSGNPIVCYNNVDNSVDYANPQALGASQIVGLTLSNIAFDTCNNCVKLGALSKSGIIFSRLNNLYVSNATGYCFYLENYQYSRVQDLNCQGEQAGFIGAGWFGASGGALYNFGNTYMTNLFAQPSQGGRGWIFQARVSAGTQATQLNDVNVYGIQTNNSNVTSSQTATFSSGVTDIAVTDLSKYPVDIPVTVTANVAGLVAKNVYFVVLNGGSAVPNHAGTGAGNIRLSGQQGSTTYVTPNANTTGTLVTYGWPDLEVAGYANNTGNGVTGFDLRGADLEGTTTTATALLQYVQGQFQFNNLLLGSAASLTTQNTFAHIDSYQELTLATDQYSAQRSIFNVTYDDTPGTVTAPNNQLPPGFCIDINKGTTGLNIGQTLYPNNGNFACDVQSSITGASHWWQPNSAIGQKSIYHSFNSSPGASGSDAASAGVDIYKATAGGVNFALTSASVTNANYGGTGQANNSTTGLPFIEFNDGTNTFTTTPQAGQFFNNVSAMTTATLPPNSSIAVRAEGDTSVGFYMLDGLSPTAEVNGISMSGCSATGLTGGVNAGGATGAYTSGTTGTCTVVLTMPLPAINGWFCEGHDITTQADYTQNQTAISATGCTLSATTVTGDLIVFDARPY